MRKVRVKILRKGFEISPEYNLLTGNEKLRSHLKYKTLWRKLKKRFTRGQAIVQFTN